MRFSNSTGGFRKKGALNVWAPQIIRTTSFGHLPTALLILVIEKLFIFTLG